MLFLGTCGWGGGQAYNGRMKRLRLYLDTTVWNFAFSNQQPDYKKATLEFYQKVRWGLYEVYYSDVVVVELAAAPKGRHE